jgi:RNA polymerase sigma-70 factor (ECF subfamily)
MDLPGLRAGGRGSSAIPITDRPDAGLAEEAVQETFLRAWRARERFDPDADTLRAWLLAIQSDVVVELGRDPARQSVRAWQVEEAMRRIGGQHRELLVETGHRGRTCAEIATGLGLPVATVQGRLNDALRALQEALEEVRFEA